LRISILSRFDSNFLISAWRLRLQLYFNPIKVRF
jgi:hypothetical protein